MSIPISALLITTRHELRDAVAMHTAGIPVVVRAPDCIALHAWTRAPVVLIDSHAANAVAELGMPHRSNLYLLADGVQPHVWAIAVKLDAERVMVLPDAFPALREMVLVAGRRAPVVAVSGPPASGRHCSPRF